MEIWNVMYRLPSFNMWVGNRFWDDQMLAKGRRTPAVGGSDMHQLVGPQSALFGVGNLTTWVLAERNGADVIDAIANGRTAISWALDAPRLSFMADADGDSTYETEIGGAVPSGDTVKFKVELVPPVAPPAPATGRAVELGPRKVRRLARGGLLINEIIEATSEEARLVGVLKNGELLKVFLVSTSTGPFEFEDSPEAGDYYRIELRGKPDVPSNIHKLLYGNVLALTSPIYAN